MLILRLMRQAWCIDNRGVCNDLIGGSSVASAASQARPQFPYQNNSRTPLDIATVNITSLLNILVLASFWLSA
jgi:hypothetical protein